MEKNQNTQLDKSVNPTSCITLDESQIQTVQEQENISNEKSNNDHDKISVCKDDKQSKKKSPKKLITIVSIVVLLLISLSIGLLFYFSGQKDKNSTLPQKVKLNVQVYSDDNKEELEHEEQVYLNYDDQIMQQEYTNKKEYKKENQAKKLISAHKNRKRRILQEVEENDEDIYTQTETKEEKVIIHTNYKERKQWKLKITDSSILCIWNQIDQNSQILPQQLSESMEQKELNQQQKNNSTYNYATTDNKTQLKINQDEEGNMQDFEIDTEDGETQKLKKIKSQLLSTNPEDPNFSELIKDLNCIEDHKDIENQIFQKNCLQSKEQDELEEKQTQEQLKEFDQYVEQIQNEQQQEDGETKNRRRQLDDQEESGIIDFFSHYANWCGPKRGGYESNSRCYYNCTYKSFSRCKRCLRPHDATDKTCMYHDKCCTDEDNRGDPQPCRNIDYPQKHSCACSHEFIEDNWYAYDYGCSWWDVPCWANAGKHIIAFKVLKCNCKNTEWFRNYNKGYYTWWGTYRSYSWDKKITYSCERYIYCDQF